MGTGVKMLEQLISRLAARGVQGRVVSIGRLADLKAAIEEPRSQGLLDAELVQTYLAEFDYRPPAALPGARSIIVVAVPQPQVGVTFTWDGKPLKCIIPPTYPEREMDASIYALLREILEPAGYRVAEASLPKKPLAVRSGLAAYGRNNISYVPGMGSFHGLVVAVTDLPVADDGWREPQMLERCRTCKACLHHCPTGAIAAERFLLHAERCLTFHNEKPGRVPFPSWMDAAWHNSLVGCLRCQWVCPENRDVRGWTEEGVAFSREETELLLAGVPPEALPGTTLEKMQRVHLDLWAELVPRNLRALLAERELASAEVTEDPRRYSRVGS
jgi:epoxyqueuosine reductase